MQQASSGGIGFFGLLALIFIGLKLGGVGAVAAWSWWWVLAPLWMPTLFAAVVVLMLGMIYASIKVWRR